MAQPLKSTLFTVKPGRGGVKVEPRVGLVGIGENMFNGKSLTAMAGLRSHHVRTSRARSVPISFAGCGVIEARR